MYILYIHIFVYTNNLTIVSHFQIIFSNVKNCNRLKTRCLDKGSVNKTRLRTVSPIPADFIRHRRYTHSVNSQKARYFGSVDIFRGSRDVGQTMRICSAFRKEPRVPETKQEAGAWLSKNQTGRHFFSFRV